MGVISVCMFKHFTSICLESPHDSEIYEYNLSFRKSYYLVQIGIFRSFSFPKSYYLVQNWNFSIFFFSFDSGYYHISTFIVLNPNLCHKFYPPLKFFHKYGCVKCFNTYYIGVTFEVNYSLLRVLTSSHDTFIKY